MRAFLIFLVLIVLVTCQPSNERMEERSRRRKEHQMKIAECILKSSDASPEFKKSIGIRELCHLTIRKIQI